MNLSYQQTAHDTKVTQIGTGHLSQHQVCVAVVLEDRVSCLLIALL